MSLLDAASGKIVDAVLEDLYEKARDSVGDISELQEEISKSQDNLYHFAHGAAHELSNKARYLYNYATKGKAHADRHWKYDEGERYLRHLQHDLEDISPISSALLKDDIEYRKSDTHKHTTSHHTVKHFRSHIMPKAKKKTVCRKKSVL